MKTEEKKLNILGALSDFVIFMLFVSGAGFAGYFIGVNQQVAPIKIVPPGTAACAELYMTDLTGLKKNAVSNPASQSAASSDKEAEAGEGQSKNKSHQKETGQPPAEKKSKSKKTVNKQKASGQSLPTYFIASKGNDYVGCVITAVVNDRPVDKFFAPGKFVDISKYVQKGRNTILLQAVELGDDYKQFPGRKDKKLTLDVVASQSLHSAYSDNEILLSYSRTSAQTENRNETFQFRSR